jgi:hypothetical protein
VPVLDRHRERREHEQEHEDVVERQRLLDQVAGQERLRVPAVADEHEQREERERHAHPHGACDRRRAQAHGAPAHDHEVDDEQDGEHADQRDNRGQRAPPRVVDPPRFLRRAGREHRAAPSGRDRP